MCVCVYIHIYIQLAHFCKVGTLWWREGGEEERFLVRSNGLLCSHSHGESIGRLLLRRGDVRCLAGVNLSSYLCEVGALWRRESGEEDGFLVRSYQAALEKVGRECLTAWRRERSQ